MNKGMSRVKTGLRVCGAALSAIPVAMGIVLICFAKAAEGKWGDLRALFPRRGQPLPEISEEQKLYLALKWMTN